MRYTILVISLFSYGLTFGQTELECQMVRDITTDEIIYKNPTISPEPKGGKEVLYKALRENVTIETTINIEGAPHELSIVGFVVCSDGKIIGERIIKKSPLPNIEKQILKVIQNLDWEPGLCMEKKVNVLMEFPMRLRIDE